MSAQNADNFVEELLPDPLPPWALVAKKEVLDAVRTWQFIALLVFFAIVTLFPIAGVLIANFMADGGNVFQSSNSVIRMLDELFSVVVPLIAVMLGYGSITKEHGRGSLKILLSLPITRRDVVLGKFLGRSVLTAIPIMIGLVVALLLLLIGGLDVDFAVYGAFLAFTLLLGIVFTGFSTGISAAVSTNFQAVFASLVSYMFLAFGWGVAVTNVAPELFTNADVGSEADHLTFMLIGQLLDPTTAYQSLIDSSVFGPMMGRVFLFPAQGGLLSLIPGFEAINRQGCTAVLGGSYQAATQQMGPRCVGSAVPLLYTDLATVLYMSLWLVVPLVLGYYFFEARDL